MNDHVQVRQGDLLIESMDGTLPNNLKKVHGNVLAYGEVTGHSHRAVATLPEVPEADKLQNVDLSGVDVFVDADGEMYVEAKKDFSVVHDEHGCIPMRAGNYKVIRQREYDPVAEKKERQVAD